LSTQQLNEILRLSSLGYNASTTEVVELWRKLKTFVDGLWKAQGHSDAIVRAIHTKFNDAGRRSAPWRPTSSRVPGRPQDGKDGNRINRWLLPSDHKFYATEKDATLVQIKYYLQAISMLNAPVVESEDFQNSFLWLINHKVYPNEYLDPIQLIPIDINEFFSNPRNVTSGHHYPLDRGGKHVPSNAFLILHRSNVLQGNLTIDDLISIMSQIVLKHTERKSLSQTQ